MRKKVFKAAITGGPCGGKTTGMAALSEHFTSRGFKVLVMPEVATLYIGGGLFPGDMKPRHYKVFQQTILQTQLELEDRFVELARHYKERSVVLFDRGVCDGRAYCTQSQWEAVLRESGVTHGALLNRYDAVVHMVSAAVGAEAFYTTANNPARQETAAQAVEADARTQRAWTGHKRLRIIDNATAFDEKVKRTIQSLCATMGEPEPLENERKFVLRNFDSTIFPEGAHVVRSEIDQYYLLSPCSGEEHRLRRRITEGHTAYYHTIKKPGARVGQRVEVERMIERGEYEYLRTTVDHSLNPIIKTRHCFVEDNLHFELDVYGHVLEGLVTVEVEVDDLDAPVNLPPWLGQHREVTGSPAFSNYGLARGVIPVLSW